MPDERPDEKVKMQMHTRAEMREAVGNRRAQQARRRTQGARACKETIRRRRQAEPREAQEPGGEPNEACKGLALLKDEDKKEKREEFRCLSLEM